MTRKHLAVMALVLVAATLLVVVLSFVPVYIAQEGNLSYYDSIYGMLGTKAFFFVGAEGVFCLAGLACLLPITRQCSVKGLFFVLALLFLALLISYIVSYNLGKTIFDLDHSHSPVGFSLFL
jgi:hypothetical protein